MKNKEIISRLKDMAELAWASYFKFDFLKDANNIPRKIYELDSNGNKIKDENSPRGHKEIEVTLEHIASIKYQEQEVLVNLQQSDNIFLEMRNKASDIFNMDKLKGDFSPTQAKNFFERYDLLIHQPNTSSGFSATLFGEKKLQIHNTTKEKSYTSQYGYVDYILAIRGTELSNWEKDIVGADRDLVMHNLPSNQYIDMILFYYQCIGKMPFFVELDSKPSMSASYQLWQRIYNVSTRHKPYIAESLLKDSTQNPTPSNFIPPITSTTKITLTGHSLGGYLAQRFCPIICYNQ